MDLPDTRFGAWLKRRRVSQGYTLRAFHLATGIPSNMVSDYERGLAIPDAATQDKLEMVLWLNKDRMEKMSPQRGTQRGPQRWTQRGPQRGPNSGRSWSRR